jgi:two-component system chemotaxis response regulator CheB
MRATIKVLIVDDSALIRQILARALALDPRIEIVGTAKNGVEAIEQARKLQPDVVTLDIEMPELSGLEALPHIIKHSDARVLMLSTLDDPETTYKALSLGAVDFIAKPKAGFATSISDLSEQLLKKIKTAYRVDPDRVMAARDAEEARPPSGEEEPQEPPPPPGTEIERVVAIAASTGGPPALERVFSGLSCATPAAYVIVQHLPEGFSTSLAKRLDSVSQLSVVEASQGVAISPGTAYLAPYGSHMTVTHAGGSPRIHLDTSPPQHGVIPAADPLFESTAELFGEKVVGVVLTGMGSDGARGLSAIKAVGGDTIAQDEETSVVWGMPGAAQRVGAVRHVVPIGLIAAEIRRAMRGRSEVS